MELVALDNSGFHIKNVWRESCLEEQRDITTKRKVSEWASTK